MFKQITKLTTVALFVAPSLLIGNVAQAENQFDVCLRELVKSGVEVNDAQVGCADALNPKDLSYCVHKIANSTDINGLDALKSCYKVRRPIELGNCVVDINEQILSKAQTRSTSESDSSTTATGEGESSTTVISNSEPSTTLAMALNTCTASLLPFRHSECVIALSRTPEVSDPNQAMQICLDAEDFPRELYTIN